MTMHRSELPRHQRWRALWVPRPLFLPVDTLSEGIWVWPQ